MHVRRTQAPASPLARIATLALAFLAGGLGPLTGEMPIARAEQATGTTTGTAPDPGPAPNPRVPLGENFSRLELVTTGLVAGAGIAMLAFGEGLFDAPQPSLGPPAAGSFDRRWADRLHLDDGSGGRFWGRAPDLGGAYVLPVAPAVVYAIDVVARARNGAPWLFTDVNADHRLIAYVEAIGWTSLTTGVVKALVGRQRPYVVLDHPELETSARQHNLSFFSGHSSLIFAAASFVSLDASRRLAGGRLAGAREPGRWLVATLLPYSLAFGAASLVGVSRVIDQQHWPSDVLIGAMLGTAIGHMTYLAHFDRWGRPRRSGEGVAPVDGSYQVRLAPTRNGIALVGLLP